MKIPAAFQYIAISGFASELRDAANAVGYHDEMPGNTTLAQKQLHLRKAWHLCLPWSNHDVIGQAQAYAWPTYSTLPVPDMPDPICMQVEETGALPG